MILTDFFKDLYIKNINNTNNADWLKIYSINNLCKKKK